MASAERQASMGRDGKRGLAGLPIEVAAAGDPEGLGHAEGWLPQARNRGWTYRDRVEPQEQGLRVSAVYAGRHRHSDAELWRQRLQAGELSCNGTPLLEDRRVQVGDRLCWQRPPWLEEAVPARWRVVHDDGDLLVLDKPAGLPVLPAGGFLEHTLLRLLEQHHGGDPAGIPRPVHRLGRFTTGLLVCARSPRSRAWLSRQLRESTTAAAGSGAGEALTPGDLTGHREDATAAGAAAAGCRKRYRALLVPGVLRLAIGASLRIAIPIGRRPHPRLGQIWSAAPEAGPGDLAALSSLTLLQRGEQADLVEVTIASGRPHQIRIHCAAIGAPLLGDPLYGPGGGARAESLPGEGGYRLQAWRLELLEPGGSLLRLEAPQPLLLPPAC